MRLLAFARDLAAPFLSEDMGVALDDNLRRAAALSADAVPEAETAVPLVQPAMLGNIDYAPFAHILTSLLRAIRQRLVCEITYARKPGRTYEMAVTRLVSGHGALYAHGWKVTDKGRVEACPRCSLPSTVCLTCALPGVPMTCAVRMRNLALGWLTAMFFLFGCTSPGSAPPTRASGSLGRHNRLRRPGTVASSLPFSPAATKNFWPGR
ncbi:MULTISPECIES: hypothetical protein [unclassified Desulfovibrio]|uniref:hypothetical protein n=1 Tax=unclassified Desulfovibrio TaxID=2593640 RepID=UPI001F14A0F3|nr:MULTISPECIES: hypothetical protein [unclassified Desulfovibrio]